MPSVPKYSAEELRQRRWRRYRDEIDHLNRYIDLCSDSPLADERVQRARDRLAWIEYHCEHGPATAKAWPSPPNPLQPGFDPQTRPHEPVEQWQKDLLMELARALHGDSA